MIHHGPPDAGIDTRLQPALSARAEAIVRRTSAVGALTGGSEPIKTSQLAVTTGDATTGFTASLGGGV